VPPPWSLRARQSRRRFFVTDARAAKAVKLAAHNGLSWEIINDWPEFQSYCGRELYKQIIDVQNAQILSGSGGKHRHQRHGRSANWAAKRPFPK
jgi:hypothetical protein